MLVRSTVNLPGLPAGRRANVDPSKPYIQRCLNAGYLVQEVAGGQRPVFREPVPTVIPMDEGLA